MDVWKNLESIPANAQQLAAYTLQALFLAHGYTDQDKASTQVPTAFLHWHDDASSPIAWNNVQAVMLMNRLTGSSLQVPLIATEGYNQHGHNSQMDGGMLPGRGIHNHADNLSGGLAFACYHPGTGLPAQRFAV